MALGERNQVLGHDAHHAAAAIRAGHASVVLHAELHDTVREVRRMRDGVEHGARMLLSVIAQGGTRWAQLGESAVRNAGRVRAIVTVATAALFVRLQRTSSSGVDEARAGRCLAAGLVAGVQGRLVDRADCILGDGGVDGETLQRLGGRFGALLKHACP